MKQRRAWCFHLMICSFILAALRKMTDIDIENKNSLCTCTHRKVHNAASQANPTHPRCWTSASRLGVQIPMHRFGKLRLPEQNLMLPKDMLFDVEDPCVLYILRVSWPPSYLPACQDGMGKRTICVSKRVSKACADTAACLRVGMATWCDMKMGCQWSHDKVMLCKYFFKIRKKKICSHFRESQTICCGCFPSSDSKIKGKIMKKILSRASSPSKWTAKWRKTTQPLTGRFRSSTKPRHGSGLKSEPLLIPVQTDSNSRWLYVYIYFLFIFLFIYLFIYLYVHIYLAIHLFIHSFIYLFIYSLEREIGR